ncbi:MAG: hypothetical protein DLM68_17015, partial [Hyphomicrobiales bacterium]
MNLCRKSLASKARSRPYPASIEKNAADDPRYQIGGGLAGCRRFGQSHGLRSSNPAWETARVNILRLVLLGLAALAAIV